MNKPRKSIFSKQLLNVIGEKLITLTTLKVLLSTLLMTFVVSCSKTEAEVSHDVPYLQSAYLEVIKPQQSYQVPRQYIGKITTKHHTNLSFQYSGETTEIFVDIGDKVKKGQRLAQQNTQLLTFKSKELQSYISQANAEINLNQANLLRIKSLIDSGYSSVQKLDELTSQNKVLTAKVNAFNARLQTISYQSKKATLVAPFDAYIGERMFSTGEIVAAGKPVFKLIEQAHNEVSVGVPSKLAASLYLGQKFTVQINQQDTQAELIAIGQQVDAANRTVQLRLSLARQIKYFNGALVKVTIEQTIYQTGFWLPLEAIIDGVRGQWNVYLAKVPPNSTSATTTKEYIIEAAIINVLYANKQAVFVSGLPKKRQLIVAKGVHRFVTGQLIKKSTQHATAKLMSQPALGNQQ